MTARALDLLRHDRVETFERLAEKLRVEYKLDEAAETKAKLAVVRDQHNDLFATRLKHLLIEKKILLQLPLDKAAAQPHEEVIDFVSASTKTTKRRTVTTSAGDVVSQETFEVTTTKFADEAKEQDPLSVVEAAAAPVETKTVTDQPNQSKPPKEEEVKLEAELGLGLGLVLAPEVVVLVPEPMIKEPEGSRIVLDTVKEPPIVFECDFHKSDKQTKKPVSVEVSSPSNTEAATSSRAVVVEKKPAEDQAIQRGGKKTTSKPRSSLLCCGPISSRKSAEAAVNAKSEKPTKLIKEEKKRAVAKVETKPAETVVAAAAAAATHHGIITVDFSNLDRKQEQPITIDFPTILSVEIERPPVVVRKEELVVVEATSRENIEPALITEVVEEKPVEVAEQAEPEKPTESNEEVAESAVAVVEEEAPSTPPTTPTLKQASAIVAEQLQKDLGQKSLNEALEKEEAKQAPEIELERKQSSDSGQGKETAGGKGKKRKKGKNTKGKKEENEGPVGVAASEPEPTPEEVKQVLPDYVEARIIETTTTSTREIESDKVTEETVTNSVEARVDVHSSVAMAEEKSAEHEATDVKLESTPRVLSDDIIKLPERSEQVN